MTAGAATPKRASSVVGALLAALTLAACGQSDPAPAPSAANGDVAEGRRAYDATCASCHGVAGRGTGEGPPLVHEIYEPSHHGDVAFLFAVRQGVPAHHWDFGDMPPQPGVSDADVADIVAYIRSLQVEAGIR